MTQPNPNYLFVANGDGTFRSVAHDLSWVAHTTGNEDWVSGGAFADLNRDGRLDLLVGHHFGTASERGPGAPLRVYLNRGVDADGNPRFDDVTSTLGLPPIDAKAPHVDIQDFDNDGWPDLYVSVIAGQGDHRGPVVFRHLGLTNDMPAFAVPNLSDPHYYPVGPVADVDRDGGLDVFLGEFRSVYQGTAQDQGDVPSLLLRNDTVGGHWLRVDVSGPAMGVGSRVSIYKAGHAGVPRALLGSRELSIGSGFSSNSPPDVHFGLGARSAVDVVVKAPRGGPRTVVSKAPADGELHVDITPRPNPDLRGLRGRSSSSDRRHAGP